MLYPKSISSDDVGERKEIFVLKMWWGEWKIEISDYFLHDRVSWNNQHNKISDSLVVRKFHELFIFLNKCISKAQVSYVWFFEGLQMTWIRVKMGPEWRMIDIWGRLEEP